MRNPKSSWADRWGTVASSVCALHCAVCALLPAALAGLGLGALLSQKAEWGFTLVAVALGLVALVLGWRVHRSRQVAGLLIVGVLGLLSSRVLEMGGEHGHHGDVHHEAEAQHEEGHHDEEDPDHEAANRIAPESGHGDGDAHEASGEHHTDEEGHDDGLHMLGAGVGVLGGILLVLGHLLNIRTTRRSREDCCD
ncbi:MAG: MerC domain-containing protein [Myxococcota bacterium]|nr:MerC domain-containing protein [Myxococcota bacterium]